MANREVNAEELRELRLDYLGDLRETVASLRQHGAALRIRKKFRNSFPVLLYIAHQLKGSGGTMGYPLISQVGADMSTRLNSFLDESAQRPTPDELSRQVLVLAGQLHALLGPAERELVTGSISGRARSASAPGAPSP